MAANVDGQIIRPGGVRSQEPGAWASFGVASVQGFTVTDGSTGSLWQFANATQYELALEKALSGGASIGLMGTTARTPLSYNGADADANVSQILAILHVANGRQLHSVLELSAGTTLYSNFRARSTGAPLPPSSPDADFTFAYGYGVGYAFSPALSVDVVRDATTVLHQRTGLAAGDNSSIRINATRLVARFGLGGR